MFYRGSTIAAGLPPDSTLHTYRCPRPSARRAAGEVGGVAIDQFTWPDLIWPFPGYGAAERGPLGSRGGMRLRALAA